MSVPILLRDLVDALEFVSAGGIDEHGAVVSRERGTVHWLSDADAMPRDEVPADIDDGALYVAIPHKNDLDLGRDLALRFAHDQLPGSYALVDSYFHKKGAYGRFKDLLSKKGQLDAWYKYEEDAIEQALRAWADESGLVVASE